MKREEKANIVLHTVPTKMEIIDRSANSVLEHVNIAAITSICFIRHLFGFVKNVD